MAEIQLRKRILTAEEIFHEGGTPATVPQRRAAAISVIANPFAGRHVEDIAFFMKTLEPLGVEMAQALARALGGDPAAIQGYGKGAIVGADGELEPDAILNVTFGADLVKLVREGSARGAFNDVSVVSFLTGEPEYLDPLKAEAPTGWIVTGYPWYGIDTPAHKAFLDAYQAKYHEHPFMGSVVGYTEMKAAAAILAKAGGTDTDKLITAAEGLAMPSPFGDITFRALDHQSTLGTYVGKTAVKDGAGVMAGFAYAPGQDFMPADAAVKAMRPHG